MRERVIPLQGVHNFRDYGGYTLRSGARLKPGVLWRSGQHKDATQEDLDRIAALNLRTIVDLRGDSERELYPCVRPANFNGDVLFTPGETAGDAQAPHVAAARGVRTADEAHVSMVSFYRTMAFRPVLIRSYRLYFEALASRNGPSLLHCLAGKDRTGLAAALLHHILGVHHDDLMADYLLTNVAGNIERRIAAGAGSVSASFGQDMDEAAVRKLMSVDAEFLDTALASINERHGSIEIYAQDVLGLTPQMHDQLVENLVE